MHNYSKFTKLILPAMALFLLGGMLYWGIYLARNYNVFQAIPSQTTLVFSFNGFKNQKRPVHESTGSGVMNLSLMKMAWPEAEQAYDVFSDVPSIRNAFENNTLAAAFSLLPADSLHPLFVLDIGEKLPLQELLAPLSKKYKLFSAVFKGYSLITIHISKTKRLVIASQGQLLLFSRFSYYVEDALVQLETRGNWWAKQPDQFHLNDGKSPIAVLLRTEVLAERLNGKMVPVWSYLPNWLSENADALAWSWGGRNWTAHSKLKKPLKTSTSGAALLDGQLFGVLPDNTALLAWASFSNRSETEQILSGGQSFDDFIQYVEPWVAPEIAYVWLEPFTPGMQEDQFLVFRIKDPGQARALLQDYGAQRGFLRQYDYQTFSIRQFLSQSLLAPVLGRNAAAFYNPVYSIVGDFVVFASSTSAMELWIDKYLVNQMLGNSPPFLQLQQNWKSTGSTAIFLNFSYLGLFVKNLVHSDLAQALENDLHYAQSIGLAGIGAEQLDGNIVSGAVATQPLNNILASSSILWKTPLDGQAIGRPNVVLLERGEPALLVQDDQFILYRMSADGAILWRKQLDRPIRSEILGIDYFNNGKACYLFNTDAAIWILNDDGREIDGYPLQLQSPATNGVTLVDFDGTRRYSIFVACQNGNLYGFDHFGRPLTGWNPQPDVETVESPLVTFKNGDKDYLAVLSNDGKLSVFNRNGTPHFTAVRLPGSFLHCPLQVDASAATPRFASMNTAGKLLICNLDGQFFSLGAGPANGDKGSMVCTTLPGEARTDFATLFDQNLTISGYEKGKFVKKRAVSFPFPQDTAFQAGCCHLLGTLSGPKKRIWLVNEKGKVHPDFPLAGTTPFVLTELFPARKNKILIVGNDNSIYAYKINGL